MSNVSALERAKTALMPKEEQNCLNCKHFMDYGTLYAVAFNVQLSVKTYEVSSIDYFKQEFYAGMENVREAILDHIESLTTGDIEVSQEYECVLGRCIYPSPKEHHCCRWRCKV
jgi:hypothetical protein